MKHTQGCWEIVPFFRKRIVYIRSNINSKFTDIARISEENKNAKADAALIAAAPEMLLALEAVISDFHGLASYTDGPTGDALKAILVQVESAIAKARGKK